MNTGMFHIVSHIFQYSNSSLKMQLCGTSTTTSARINSLHGLQINMYTSVHALLW